jgi:hypothetical protein
LTHALPEYQGGEPVRAAEAIVRGISRRAAVCARSISRSECGNGERGSYQATALRIMQAYFPEAEEAL